MKLRRNLLKVSSVILFSFSLMCLHAQAPAGDLAFVNETGYDASLKSPIDLQFPASVKISYKTPFRGTIKVVLEELPTQNLPKEYMIEVNAKKGAKIGDNYIVVDGEKYRLVQFHLHAPSEHMVNGRREPGEIHFVHKSDDGKVAVIGAFITEGSVPNRAYKELLNAFPKILTNMPQHEGEGHPVALKRMIDPAKLLPLKSHSYAYAYRYPGSKTSGTLDPGVKWTIFTDAIEFSAAQLEMLTPIESTGTKIHPLLGRPVTIEGITVSH